MGLLTAPVNSLTDYQAEYDGLLLGAGTAYDLPPDLPFLNLPPVKVEDDEREGADGAVSAPDYAGTATWTTDIEVWAQGTAAFGAAVTAFRQTMRIRAVDAPFWFKLPGLAVQGIGLKVINRSVPVSNLWSQLAACSVQWRAVQPRLQSVVRTALLQPSTASSGMHFPLHSPTSGSGTALDFGVAATGPSTAAVTNAGNTDAPIAVAVAGPTPGGFTITLDGHAVTYAGALAAGDVVTLDYDTNTAWLSSSGTTAVDRTYLLTSRDFTLVPAAGRSTVAFTAGSGTATVSSADIWR